MGAINRYNFLRWTNVGLTGSGNGGILYKLSTTFETDSDNNNQYEPDNIDLNLYYGATLDTESDKIRITCPATTPPTSTYHKFLDTNLTWGSTAINRNLIIKFKVNYGTTWILFKRVGESSFYISFIDGSMDFDNTFNYVRYQYSSATHIWTVTMTLEAGKTFEKLEFTVAGISNPSGTQLVILDVELQNSDFIPVSTDFDEVKVLPKYNPKAKGQMAPLLVPGEQTSFYLNTVIGITDDLVLHVINANTLVSVQSIGIVSKVEFAEGFHFYHTFTNPSIARGYYKLGLFQNGVLALTSNDIFVLTSKYDEVSMRFKFRHNANMFGFNYDRVPTFYQQFRLPIIESECQINYDIDQYKSTTSKKTRNYYNVTERYRKFDSLYFDELAHEAAGIMIEHDLIYINEGKFTFKQGYKINEDPISRVSKGEFELFEEKFIDDKYAQLTTIS